MFDPNNSEHGHESWAEVFEDPKHGKSIILRPTDILNSDRWVKKWRQNKEDSDRMRELGNRAYFIPEIRVIDRYPEPYVIIQHAPGKRLSPEIFKALSPEKQNKIISAAANFLNDMHQLKPVQIITPKFETWGNKKETPESEDQAEPSEFDKLKEMLGKLGPLVSAKNKTAALFMQETLDKNNFKIIKVWSHRDLRFGNIFYDDATETVSFIDFGEADYTDLYNEVFKNDHLKELFSEEQIKEFIKTYLALPKAQQIDIDPEKDRGTYDSLRKIRMNAEWAIEEINRLNKAINDHQKQNIFANSSSKLSRKAVKARPAPELSGSSHD